MPQSHRVKRLQKLALQTASEVVLYELSDPRLSLVTLTRCSITNDLAYATIRWSVIGTEGDRSKARHALQSATGVVQKAIARAFQARKSPRIRWEFDKSVEGALRVSRLLDDLNEERAEREGPEGDDGAEDASDPDRSAGDEGGDASDVTAGTSDG